ncbi:MAG: hypothetical protein JWN17_1505, partial [Frankiales bacterium]|nr:hypothetical protein [Frankiales bacterium]
MTPVDPPALLPGLPPVLGALSPALHRLAALQGQWPPHAPQQ